MKQFMRGFCGALLTIIIVGAPSVFAQCNAHLLAALDENNPLYSGQRFDVSVWTGSPYCPASGQIMIRTEPPGSALIAGDPFWVDSFFDVFTEVETVKPPIVPTVPPGTPFQIITEVTFDDPVYPALWYEEMVQVTPMNRLEIIHPLPCTSSVPPDLFLGSGSCFTVCHGVYTVALIGGPINCEPIIHVTPGCTMPPCGPQPCLPGSPDSYRYEVYQYGGQWYLEFEYSNPYEEPVCYCVNYVGYLPHAGETYVLGGWENARQDMNVSVWTNNLMDPISGTIEIFSYPAGAQFEGGGGGGGMWIESFFDVFMEPWTADPPVGPGIFTPGQQFQLIGYIHYDPPGLSYPPQWVVEDVVVTPSGGLQLVNPGCTGPVIIPPQITPGVPACLNVCHDIYYIPLDCEASSTPEVQIFSGCDLTTPCASTFPCTPGAMTDFRYDVYRVGGTWILEFEYSNEQIQPVCYCVDVSCPSTPRPVAYGLGALSEWHQTFDVSVWGSSPRVPLNGTIHYRSEPPGAALDWPVDSFFDVFLEPFTSKVPVMPGIFLPGETFHLIAEIDFFGPGSDPFDGIIYDECVVVTPSGQLALWDPITPCGGDYTPGSMSPGQSECFRVCHRVYEIVLNYLPGGGRPVISVTPGCQGPPFDNCVMEACVPGGPNDFVYDVYHNGVDWILRFEYSNPYVEPVCYCVTYEGNVPFDCETHELAALDEIDSFFDVSLHTFSPSGQTCPASGMITLYSYPEGAYIGPYIDSFFDVFTEWYTVKAPVGPGTFGPGEAFQLIAYIDYTEPAYPDQWLTEEVMVNSAGTGLVINDTGGECTGDIVPPAMNLGMSACFKVCHRIYHIPIIDATDPANPPTVIVTPGCFGEPQDHCLPDPECTPGHPDYYRYDLIWMGDHWELEFEYSNENVEPVCYCVTVEGTSQPCETHALVALDSDNQLLKVSLMSRDPGGTLPCEVSGTVRLQSVPFGLYFQTPTWHFFGVGEEWVAEATPVARDAGVPDSFFDVFVEIDFDDPAQPDMIETESVMVDPVSGGLVINDVGGQCPPGAIYVPDTLHYGQPECFKVCHDIYYVSLDIPGPQVIPVVTVTPGCDPSATNCSDPACTPGGPFDYRYDVFKVGGSWILEFEYSNEDIEPVCYCVEVSAINPVPFEAYMLGTLNEVDQTFDITLWTSPGAPLADGSLIVYADPISASVIPFTGVGADYVTWHVPVTTGTLLPGQDFELIARVQFNDPVFGRWEYHETVMIDPTGIVIPWDPITPCIGDNVPSVMDGGASRCFIVCHKVYDILLNISPLVTQPLISVTPGCFGAPLDSCPVVDCRPGGPLDYCYRFYFDGIYWHLLFEYSNMYRQPVCYCVTILSPPPPCDPVPDLVILWPNVDTGAPLQITFTCPQDAEYLIYSTTDPNNHGDPPGPLWSLDHTVLGLAGQQITWVPVHADNAYYRNYVVKARCGPH